MSKYTVYKTTNLVNGKYYLGVHKTLNIHDSYLGSGTYIKKAVAKYGVQSFSKEVLEVFDTQREAWDKESDLIDLYRTDPLCMNIRKGGSGGFDYINQTGLAWSKTEGGRESARRHLIRVNINPSQSMVENKRRAQKRAAEAWRGKKHTEEAKEKVRQVMLTESNTFRGRKWMFNPLSKISEAVPASLIDLRISQGWAFGRNHIIKKRGKMWVNDGGENRMIDEGAIPEGWVRGRIGIFLKPVTKR